MSDEKIKRQRVLYSEEIADEIIERTENGEPLTKICKYDTEGFIRAPGKFPKYSAVYNWADPDLPQHKPEFVIRFAKARLHQHRYWIEETVEIADTPYIGTTEIRSRIWKLGVYVDESRITSGDMLEHRKLMIETRLKAAAKLDAKLWSDRLQTLGENDINGDAPKIIVEGGLPGDD